MITKVRCIDDDFSMCDILKPIIIVGDELPVKNKIYQVEKEVVFYLDAKLNYGYLLTGLDYSAYGFGLCFLTSRFEVIEQVEAPLSFNPHSGEVEQFESFTLVYTVPDALKHLFNN